MYGHPGAAAGPARGSGPPRRIPRVPAFAAFAAFPEFPALPAYPSPLPGALAAAGQSEFSHTSIAGPSGVITGTHASSAAPNRLSSSRRGYGSSLVPSDTQ